MSVSAEFESQTDPFRAGLLVCCYQMLGSADGAEDMVQETMLRARRACGGSEEASPRNWLYRIAVKGCLAILERPAGLKGPVGRSLPSGSGKAARDPHGPLVYGGQTSWLQPFPEGMLSAALCDPSTPSPAELVSQGKLRLALAAAMQALPPRQRAALVLSDVLDFPAADVAAVLDATADEVGDAVRSASARLAQAGVRQVCEPCDPRLRTLAGQYAAAFEDADVARLARTLTGDVVLEMPPFRNWYLGRAAYTQFIDRVFATRGTDWRMTPVAANGQPAVAAYVRTDQDAYHLNTIQVFGGTGAGISRTVTFPDPRVFVLFDVPPVLEAAATAAARR